MTKVDLGPGQMQARLRRLEMVIAAGSAFGVVALFVVMTLIPFDEKVRGPGFVRPEVESRIYAPADGLVERILVRDREHVIAGQPLLEMDPTEIDRTLERQKAALREAEAQLRLQQAHLERVHQLPLPKDFWHVEQEAEDAQDRLNLAEREVRRYQMLQTSGAGTAQEADRAVLNRDIAKSQIERAQSKLQLLRSGFEKQFLAEAQAEADSASAAVEKIRTEIRLLGEERERLTLTAPSDGTVTLLMKRRPGQPVAKGEKLFNISHGQASSVVLSLGDREIHRVQPGQTVLMRSRAFDWMRHGYIRGVVERVSTEPQRLDDDSESAPAYLVVVRVTQTPQALAVGSEVEGAVLLRRVPLWQLLFGRA